MTFDQFSLAEAMKRSQNASTKRKLARVSKRMNSYRVAHYTATLLVTVKCNVAINVEHGQAQVLHYNF